LNQSELNALSQSISNDARVLYCLGLRPTADEEKGISKALNYKHLLTLLNGKDDHYTLGRQINALIKELLNVGLVGLHQQTNLDKSFNGETVVLPLLITKQDDYSELHLTWSAMTLDWQPNSELLADLSQLVGIIDKEYSHNELGEFVAYWMGRPQMQFSQFQWTQKFVFQLKQRRLANGISTSQKVGSQLVKPKASVEADDNAKKLVEKYRTKQ
jgi:DNA replication protein DnaT